MTRPDLDKIDREHKSGLYWSHPTDAPCLPCDLAAYIREVEQERDEAMRAGERIADKCREEHPSVWHHADGKWHLIAEAERDAALRDLKTAKELLDEADEVLVPCREEFAENDGPCVFGGGDFHEKDVCAACTWHERLCAFLTERSGAIPASSDTPLTPEILVRNGQRMKQARDELQREMPSDTPKPCQRCDGSGVTYDELTSHGYAARPCPACSGSGKATTEGA